MMRALRDFEVHLTRRQSRLIVSLDSPHRIQAFLDDTPYSTDQINRCPLSVLRDRRANCFDGALFAAAALARLGHPPRICELAPNDRDDEHLLALFKQNGAWGAVAQSNFVGLRFREPLFRSVRDLALSYFEQYFNVHGEKTLRGYRKPLNLALFDRLNWTVSNDDLEAIAARLDRTPVIPLLSLEMIANLSPVDQRTLRAGLLGADARGLFRPCP